MQRTIDSMRGKTNAEESETAKVVSLLELFATIL